MVGSQVQVESGLQVKVPAKEYLVTCAQSEVVRMDVFFNFITSLLDGKRMPFHIGIYIQVFPLPGIKSGT